MSDQVVSPMIPRGSRFWGLVRWTFAAALVIAILLGATRHEEATFGYLGGLTGIALLEIRCLREERHPFLSWSNKQVNAAILLLVAVNVSAVTWLLAD